MRTTMHTCDDCRVVLESDVRYCPKCGKGVAAEDEAESGSFAEVRSLVASANLNRINGDFDAAVADASLALKHNPNNPEVASLLAGIYEQRGDLDEAQVWFKIAADLDPDSGAYRARLHRVDELIATKSGRARSKRRDLTAWLLIGAAVVVLLVVGAYALVTRPGSRAPRQTVGAGSRHTSSPGQITNPVGGAGAGESGRQSLAGRGTDGAAGGTALRTPAETTIKTAASESAAARDAHARVDDVIADPRQAIASVTFTLSGTAPASRERVLTAAMGIARAAFGANREVKFVTARCIIGAGDSAQMAFIGDIARTSAEGLPETPEISSIGAAFANKWWNPQVR